MLLYVQMSKSILDYFRAKSQEVKKSVSETDIISTTAESISDCEIDQDFIEADRDKSQEVKKSTEISPATDESLSDSASEDLFEALKLTGIIC